MYAAPHRGSKIPLANASHLLDKLRFIKQKAPQLRCFTIKIIRETEEDAQTLAALDALRRKLCMPLKNYETASVGAQTAREQAQALAAFLKELDLAQTLSDRAKKLSGRGLGALAAEYAQLWDLLIGALEQFASVLGDMPMEREEFSQLLLAMLAQYDIGTIPAAQDAVSAGEMDRMRRRHLKHLIVLGASDERLPAPEKPELLLWYR